MAKLAYRAKRVSRKLLRNLTINNAKNSGYLQCHPAMTVRIDRPRDKNE